MTTSSVEAAIARLGIIGGRAVDRLTDAYTKAERSAHPRRHPPSPRSHRQSAKRAARRRGDSRRRRRRRRCHGVSCGRSSHPQDTATATLALDALVATTLESTHDRRLRQAAFDALHEVPPDVRRATWLEALRSDPRYRSDDAADAITMRRRGGGASGGRVDRCRSRDDCPTTPEALREALAVTWRVGAAQYPARDGRCRARPRTGRRRCGRGAGGCALRGALHQALALRGSRVALYDLRETLEERPARLPTSFLAALHVLGDASCLEPIGAAWAAGGSRHDRRRRTLAAAAGIGLQGHRPAREDYEATRRTQARRGALAGSAARRVSGEGAPQSQRG